ncbi:MAG: hypothetical protein WCP28_17485 [Actinomycetes bacterium]
MLPPRTTLRLAREPYDIRWAGLAAIQQYTAPDYPSSAAISNPATSIRLIPSIRPTDARPHQAALSRNR